jgi:transcriptional regulator with XRE-family HTH domain
MVLAVAKNVSKSNMKPIDFQIGLRLRALRKTQSLSQESLASRCQIAGHPISRNKIAKYELGVAEVPARFIPKLAQILNVSITDLLPPVAEQSQPKVLPRPLQKPMSQKPVKLTQKNDAPVPHLTSATVETKGHKIKGSSMLSFSTTLKIPLKSLLAEWLKTF